MKADREPAGNSCRVGRDDASENDAAAGCFEGRGATLAATAGGDGVGLRGTDTGFSNIGRGGCRSGGDVLRFGGGLTAATDGHRGRGVERVGGGTGDVLVATGGGSEGCAAAWVAATGSEAGGDGDEAGAAGGSSGAVNVIFTAQRSA
ncbi:MAG: hypothetical protein ABTR07_12505 [Candidatus Competibacter denitrificans]